MNWQGMQYIITPLLLVLSGFSQAAIPTAQRDALLSLYHVNGGPNWHNSTAWQGDIGSECSWYGVTCNAQQTTVTGLDLKANNLKGTLPAALTKLTDLNRSDFRYNALYSIDQSLIDFLDSSGPVGSLLDTQTLDAVVIDINNAMQTSFDINWQAVNYTQAGGYRIYLASQVEDGVGVPHISDFVKVIDINDKAVTSYTLAGLTPCTQYFVKVSSFTLAHNANSNAVESDAEQQNIYGSIPNWGAGCDLNIYSTATVSLLAAYSNEITIPAVDIIMKLSGDMFYTFTYPGEAPVDNQTSCNSHALMLDSQVSVNTSQITCLHGGDVVLSQETQPGSIDPVNDSSEGIGLVFEIPNIDILESTQIDTIIHKITGYFADSINLNYSIIAGNVGDMFRIESSNNEGLIKLNGVLDVDSRPTYLLEIKIENELAQQVTIPVQITVLADNNDTPEQAKQDAAAGCTLHIGAPFDPVWIMMLILAGAYRTGRQAQPV